MAVNDLPTTDDKQELIEKAQRRDAVCQIWKDLDGHFRGPADIQDRDEAFEMRKRAREL